MRKHRNVLLLTAALLITFGLGYLLGNSFRVTSLPFEKKPVLGIEQQEHVVEESTPVIFEQEYKKCGHIVISAFEHREELNGKSLDELRRAYTEDNGYKINWQGDALLISQAINDWCLEDKEKCRLKEYQGRVAVFKGPDSFNDVLIKATTIEMKSLPEEIARAIQEGEYEFDNEQMMNDALESLDDFI